MEYVFNQSLLADQIEELGDAKRLAFGVFLLERALPGFFQFQIDSGYLGGGELRAALAQCWHTLEAGQQYANTFITVEACEKFLPDSEDHSSAYTSAAIDAVDIACDLLSYLQSAEKQLLIDAAVAQYDTVYLFIQNNSYPDSSGDQLADKIVHHPLMQEELRFMYSDIEFLRTIPNEGHAVWLAALEHVTRLDYRKLRLK